MLAWVSSIFNETLTRQKLHLNAFNKVEDQGLILVFTSASLVIVGQQKLREGFIGQFRSQIFSTLSPPQCHNLIKIDRR